MKVGMKIYSSEPERIESISSYADYIEILVVPGVPLSPFLDFDFPYRIHAAHEGFGVNPADKSSYEANMSAIREAIAAAEHLSSPTVVIHPGNGPKEEALRQLTEVAAIETDRKLLLENLPKKLDGEHELMNFPEEAPEFLDLGFGLCLDIGHAAGAAAAEDRDYKNVLNAFMELNPHYFHVSNGVTESTYDLHMPLMEGDLDIGFFKRLILTKRDAWVTLEVPNDPERNEREFHYFKEVL